MFEEWYNEIVTCRPNSLRKVNDNYEIIHRGFKFVKYIDGTVNMFDVRYSDLYSEVSEENLKIFRVNGFVKGSNIISLGYTKNNLSILEIEKNELIEEIMLQEEHLKNPLSTNIKLISKRLRLKKEYLDELIDQITMFKIKINQLQNE